MQNIPDADREKELNKDMDINGANTAGEAQEDEDELDDELERERERFLKKEQEAYNTNEIKVDLEPILEPTKEEPVGEMEVESESEEDPLQGIRLSFFLFSLFGETLSPYFSNNYTRFLLKYAFLYINTF